MPESMLKDFHIIYLLFPRNQWDKYCYCLKFIDNMTKVKRL